MSVTEWEEVIGIWKGRSFLEGPTVVPLYQILSDYITLRDAKTAQRGNVSRNVRNLQVALALQFPTHWFEIALWVDIPGYLVLRVHPKTRHDEQSI